MQVVHFLSARQKALIDAINQLGSIKHAARMLKIPPKEVEGWRSDPDVALALDLAEGQGNATLYQKAIQVVHANLEKENMYAAEMVLKATDPEKWNPAHRVQVEAVHHRFIDFNGQEIHGNVIDGEVQDSNADND